ncbi:hypothetical protein QR680_018725 [Steinernema hermaphroditum]|uniref:Rubicon Homology domain-containing protein n=1 Tax=Steinernema hermaphroditum TaxID=289476 RepID=A0AA39HIU0_9BILA|nr:hypothetical protein QR680_018725 [Steinernema hermaphroditum]
MGEEEASSTSSSPSVPTTAFRRFMSDSLLAQRSDDLLNLEHRKPTQLCSRTQSMLFTPAPALFPGSSSARIASDSTKRSRMTSVSDDELATARNHDRALGQLQRHVPKESLLLIERLGGDSRPTRRTRKDQMHLHLSEVLISTFEQLSWKRKMNELKAELAAENGEEALLENHVSMQPSTSFSDFRNRVEDDTAVASTSAQFGHKTEGNSTFYQSAEGGEDKEEDEDELEEPLMQFEQCNLNGDTRESPPPNEDSPLLNRRNESECTSEGDPENDPSSAERIASDLLKYFASQQEVMESVNPEDVKWLVSFADAPQKLLPMPSSSDVVVSPDEIYTPDGKRILLRGTTSWAPPKKKFIFREPPYAVQRDMIETQNFRCAGCGMKLDKVYIKRTRYCNYYGKWFCQVCHQGAKHRIPAKIIKSWDFQAYPVSDIAFNFLSENVYQPVFDIGAIDGSLYVRNKQMRRLQQIRLKLAHLWSYISVCKVAQRTVTESGNLKTMFTSLPQRYLLLNQVEVYSLADLEQVYTKNLQQSLEPVVRYGELHVESCEECRHRGYFCELCQFSELLFPFHIDKVERCGDCGALVHMKCYKKMRKENPQITCTKCERRRFHDQRRQLSLTRSDVEDHE